MMKLGGLFTAARDWNIIALFAVSLLEGLLLNEFIKWNFVRDVYLFPQIF